MRAMHRAFILLRERRLIGGMVGAFVLSIILAVSAPWMQGRAFDQICSANGANGATTAISGLLVNPAEPGSTPADGRLHGMLHCVLCLPLDMPVTVSWTPEPVLPQRPAIADGEHGRAVEILRWAALPVRAPPYQA